MLPRPAPPTAHPIQRRLALSDVRRRVSRDRELETRVGTLDPAFPEFCQLLLPRRCSDDARPSGR